MNPLFLSKIRTHLEESYPEKALKISQLLDIDTDLLQEEFYDSMGFMELLSFLMDEYGNEIEFESLDLDSIGKVSYLAKVFSGHTMNVLLIGDELASLKAIKTLFICPGINLIGYSPSDENIAKLLLPGQNLKESLFTDLRRFTRFQILTILQMYFQQR